MNNSQPAKANYSFTVNSTGNNHEFTYRKSKFGIKMYFALLWPAIIAGGFLGYFSRPQNMDVASTFTMGVFYWIVYSLLLPIAIIILINLLRQPGKFTISESAISFNGISYSYKDINSMYVKSPGGERIDTMVYSDGNWGVTGGNRMPGGYNAANALTGIAAGVAGVTNELGQASKRAIIRNYKSRNSKVCILYGEREIAIASGLTVNAAQVLRSKIDELI